MSVNDRQQIFFDTTGRRTPLVYTLLAAAALFLGALLTVFVVSVSLSPALPAVRLNLERQYISVLAAAHHTLARKPYAINNSHKRSRVDKATSGTPRLAFYVNWDKNSFLSLRTATDHLDGLLPEWLHLSDAEGGIDLDDSREQEHVAAWMEINAPHLKVMPVVNNYDPKSNSWQGDVATRLLRSDVARARFVRNVQTYLDKGSFDGIVIDFKKVPPADQRYLADLLRELKAVLAPLQRRVLLVLPAYEKPSNFHELVEAADQIILLVYDQHAPHEQPGPIAGQAWFETVLSDRFETTPGDKLIVAIGSYATDWNSAGPANSISVREAWHLLQRSGATLAFDGPSLNPTFSYSEIGKGTTHTVWMLDGVTMYNQIAAALAMEPGGLALWRLGTEDPTIWASFARGRAPNDAALAELKTLDPGTTVTYTGKGEVLRFAGQPEAGQRVFTHLAQYNLITEQSLVSTPRPMLVSRFGFNLDKVIALTFDDGPSRVATPAILDILKKKNVKASFFVLGAAAALEPDILKRLYEEGHDIGNHTFTHPNLSEIPSTLLDLELNATQRVLEANLGIQTVLFRPPYVNDIEPETQGQAQTLLASANLGYIAIGNRIDPLDWGRPGVEEIVQRTVSYALRQNGNVVLLHDGGGDRSQTIAALPKIIDRLSSEGFRFVTIHELLGLKRDELMPIIPKDAEVIPYVNGIGFSLMRLFHRGLNFLFVAGITLGIGRLLVIAFVACGQSYRKATSSRTWPATRSFDVIVPAHNEERVIVECIRSLLDSQNQNFNILVVDDGSTDSTARVVRNAFPGNERIRLITKPNGGKSSALNLGIGMTNAEIVVLIDADTRLAPDALDYLLAGFEDKTVGAVAGVVTVGNPSTMLAKFQALEYLTAQSMDRRAFECVNGIAVVPGAIGAWRREAVIEAGLFESDTSAEDADLTFKLVRSGWVVRHEPRALAITEAPEQLREFTKQRFRWMFGMLQVAFKHRGIYAQRGSLGLKLFTVPNIVVFQFLFTLLSPIMDALLVGAFAVDGWAYMHHGAPLLSEGTVEILMYWGGFQAIELAFAGVALWLHGDRRAWGMLHLALLQRFYYRQLLFWIALRALFAMLRGRFIAWGRAKRMGSGTGFTAVPAAVPAE